MKVSLYWSTLPRYRVPVFRELASRPDIVLRVRHGDFEGIENVRPSGFEADHSPVFTTPLIKLYWTGAHSRLVADEPAVAVIEWNVRFIPLIPTIFRLRRRGIGVVLWGHGYSKKASRLRTFFRMAVGRGSHVVVLYDYSTADKMLKDVGFRCDRVFVAPNTIDQSRIRSAKSKLESDRKALDGFRAQHGLSGPTVIFVSRLISENRVDVLLDAIAELRRRGTEARCVVIGSGPSLQALTQKVCELAIDSLVTFVPATYDEEDLAFWFMSADALCYPSNAGLSLLHAFAYGLPVVVGNDRTKHNPEIDAFQNGVNGLEFQDGDSGALATSLESIFSDEELRTRLQMGARVTAERYSLERMVDGLESAIRTAYRMVRSADR